MKRLLLVTFINVFLQNILYSQKVIFCEAKEIIIEAMLPVVSKEGKKPNLKKVLLKTYFLTYSTDGYGSRVMTVGRYLESYKDEIIKEIVFDTEEIGGRISRYQDSDPNFITNRLIVKDIINTAKSATEFFSLCCSWDSRVESPILKTDDFKINSVIRNKREIFTTQGEFYESFSDDQFIQNLMLRKFDDQAIQEFLKVKKFRDTKYKIYYESEKWSKQIHAKNIELKNELRKFIPNLHGRDSPGIVVDAYNHEDIKFIFLDEHYLWGMKDPNSLVSNHNGHLQIIFPEGHPYEGEVYLKQIAWDGFNGYERIMEVYRQDSKNVIPFKRLMVELKANKNLFIYGWEGTFNSGLTFLTDDEKDNLIDVVNPKWAKHNAITEFEKNLFVNYYLRREIPLRKKFLNEYYAKISLENEKNKIQVAVIYENEKKESLSKNGFFLETRNINSESDSNIDYRLLQIYKGKFNVDGKIDIDDYSSTSFEDIEILNIVHSAAYNNARRCNSEISDPNRVEIFEDVCIEEEVTTDKYGREISRDCSAWKQKPTGLFTPENIYEALVWQKKKMNSISGLGNILNLISDPNKGFGTLNSIGDIKQDIANIYLINDCNSKALLRFEENLVRYVKGQEPLRLY